MVAVWKTLSHEIAFERAPYVTVSREVVEVAPGHVIEDFWQVDLRSFVLVVPVLEDGRIFAQRAYRHGARRVCLGFPGGFIDPGETPQQAVVRELAEESGLIPGDLRLLGQFVDNGNQRGCLGHYFVATGCKPGATRLSCPTESAEDLHLTVPQIDEALETDAFGIVHHVAGWGLARRFCL
jgi:ADP-ribose pyrophosphatase